MTNQTAEFAQWINLLLYLKLMEYCGGGGEKSVRVRGFAMRLCHLSMSEATPIKSHGYVAKVGPKSGYTNRHAKVDRGKPTGPHSYIKTYRQLRDIESRRNSLRMERACLLVIQY